MNWDALLDRLAEPSTWRGIVGLIAVAGITFKPELTNAIVAAAVAVVALIEVIRKEKPNAPPPIQ